MSKDIHHHIRPIPPVPPFAPIPPDEGYPHPVPHRHGQPHNHSARFRPMLLHPHIPHHFNFWCNKVIPLAYDDSLSYYEVLAKVADYLNNMLNDEKMLMINIEELAQSFCELQGFVNDYFAFYQSMGIINYEIAITNENYREILPNADEAQMNTAYRMQFVDDTTQNVPENLPESAKPYTGECVLFNLSNFMLKRVGNEWVEVTDDNKEYSTKGNYQLFITDKDIYFRENNGDSWGEWQSIFANWWSSTFEDVKTWVREYIAPIVDDLNARIDAEIARATAAEQVLDSKIDDEIDRATAAEQALDDKIDDEIDRATAAEQGLSTRLVAEYNRAVAAEQALDTKIEAETTRATNAESGLRADLNSEISRATAAEGTLNSAIQAEATRATSAESALNTALQAEVSRATAAESALNTSITDEVSRATTAESALSTAITGEVSRATAAESALNTAINAEVSRATAAESALSTRVQTNADNITGEVSRATAAEQAIREGYVPNVGNDKSGDFTLERDGDITLDSDDQMSLHSENGTDISSDGEINITSTDSVLIDAEDTVTIQAGDGDMVIADGNINFSTNGGAIYFNTDTTDKVYYGGDTANDEVATVGDVAAVSQSLDGYVPNAGNSLDGNFVLSRGGNMVLKGDTFSVKGFLDTTISPFDYMINTVLPFIQEVHPSITRSEVVTAFTDISSRVPTPYSYFTVFKYRARDQHWDWHDVVAVTWGQNTYNDIHDPAKESDPDYWWYSGYTYTIPVAFWDSIPYGDVSYITRPEKIPKRASANFSDPTTESEFIAVSAYEEITRISYDDSGNITLRGGNASGMTTLNAIGMSTINVISADDVIVNLSDSVTQNDLDLNVEGVESFQLVCTADYTLDVSGNQLLYGDGDGIKIGSSSPDTFIDVGQASGGEEINLSYNNEFNVKYAAANSYCIVCDSDGVCLKGTGTPTCAVSVGYDNTDEVTITAEEAVLLKSISDKVYYDTISDENEVATVGDIHALCLINKNNLTSLSNVNTILSHATAYQTVIFSLDHYTYDSATPAEFDTSHYADITAVFKNCTFNFNNTGGLKIMGGHYVFENCVFIGDNPNTNNTTLSVEECNSVTFNNCVFNDCNIKCDQTSYAIDNIKFINCKVGQYSILNIALDDNSAYTQVVTIEGCVIKGELVTYVANVGTNQQCLIANNKIVTHTTQGAGTIDTDCYFNNV